jgi:hypothetical protein
MNLGCIDLSDVTGVLEEDPGMVVRRARAITDEDRAKLREQLIERLLENHRQTRGAR